MKLSSKHLQELCDVAIIAAKEAGSIISSYSNKDIEVNSKANAKSLATQVVTEVDLKSQDAILKHILPTCEKFDLALLTEESIDDQSRLKKDYFWCIDPLDGTLPFVRRQEGYAVSIALVAKDGTPEIGVVFDPLKSNVYSAIRGCGAMRNGAAFLMDSAKNNLTLIADNTFLSHKLYDEILNNVKILSNQMGYEGVEVRKYGGAVMNACWVMENSPACCFKFPKHEDGCGSLWDYAATACIFNETDGVVGDIHGDRLDLNRTESAYMNKNGMMYASNKGIASGITQMYNKMNV